MNIDKIVEISTEIKRLKQCLSDKEQELRGLIQVNGGGITSP